MTRRKARRLHGAADKAWENGICWTRGEKVSAPAGGDPLRVAFDAGLEFQKKRETQKKSEMGDLAGGGWLPHMPLDVWALVYAEYMRSDFW